MKQRQWVSLVALGTVAYLSPLAHASTSSEDAVSLIQVALQTCGNRDAIWVSQFIYTGDTEIFRMVMRSKSFSLPENYYSRAKYRKNDLFDGTETISVNISLVDIGQSTIVSSGRERTDVSISCRAEDKCITLTRVYRICPFDQTKCSRTDTVVEKTSSYPVDWCSKDSYNAIKNGVEFLQRKFRT